MVNAGDNRLYIPHKQTKDELLANLEFIKDLIDEVIDLGGANKKHQEAIRQAIEIIKTENVGGLQL